jgi:hypothetical protein
MANSTFSGPIRAGTVREGPSANVGYCVMAQTAAWTQSTTAASTGIIIPANAQILDIQITVVTACDGASQNLSIGTSATATELATAIALGTSDDTIFFASAGTLTDLNVWADVGTSDVTIWIDFSAGSAGEGYITVQYLQGQNLE